MKRPKPSTRVSTRAKRSQTLSKRPAWPEWAGSGPNWPEHTRIGPKWAELGSNWAALASTSPNWTELDRAGPSARPPHPDARTGPHWRELVRIGPNWTERPPASPKGQSCPPERRCVLALVTPSRLSIWARVGPNWPKPAALARTSLFAYLVQIAYLAALAQVWVEGAGLSSSRQLALRADIPETLNPKMYCGLLERRFR